MREVRASPFSPAPLNEQRAFGRFKCDIPVRAGEQPEIARITDIALEGCFLETTSRLKEAGSHTLVFPAGEFGRVVAEARVVHLSPAGVGMKFTRLPPKGGRRLRRFVAELNTIEGHRSEAASLQDQAAAQYTIVDQKKISVLLEHAKDKNSRFTVIPARRNERQSGKLVSRSDGSLSIEFERETSIKAGEQVFVLFTLGYDSYSFGTEVLAAIERQASLARPVRLGFSERRSVIRQKPTGQATISLSVPWKEEPAEWPVYDLSAGGFAMRVASGNALFLPGTPLQDAVVHVGGKATPLPDAVVKHVTHVREMDGREWWKIGVSRVVERAVPEVVEQKIAPSTKRSRVHRIKHWASGVGDKAMYLYHTRLGKFHRNASLEPFQVVHLKNRDNRDLVGLLNLSFPSTGRIRAPLVLVVPAFGSRKETLSALAQTLTHNFRRRDRDLAVLRLDGVNNLGESEKDPGLHQDGKQTMHFTVSDGVSDVLGALAWARNNPYFEATDTIIVSVSFSSIAVRVALTRPEASCVARWIAYMGAADVQNSVMNVSGNYDAWGRYVRGMRNGIVTLQGCMVDGDRFCADVEKLGAATVDDARRDLMKISVPITWMVGSYDAWMDPARIHDIMSAAAPAERKIVEVDAGHTPTSSDEALAQFQLITRLVWLQLFDEEIDAVVPPRGLIAAVANQEWARVRREDSLPREEYWRSYLLSDEKHGYNLLRHLPAYRDFAAAQASEAEAAGANILDLGAGTGIVANAILDLGPKQLTCADIVEPALERLRTEFANRREVQVVRADADGNPRTAIRRWLSGELGTVHDLIGRVPGVTKVFADLVSSRMDQDVHALLRGADMDPREVRRAAGLAESLDPLLCDLNMMAKVELGFVPVSTAVDSLRRVPRSVFECEPGLPLEDESYDAVVCSLLLSYLQYPADCLAECRRILKPGGRLVVSSMKPDADTSIIYREFIDTLDATRDDQLSGMREELIAAARGLLNKAAELVRHEKEGLFCFFSTEQLSSLVRRAGFTHVRIRYAYGSPPQAIVVSCRKPEILH